MTVTNATNRWSVCNIIVDSTAGKGDYTTIQAAINAASSGDVIYVREGTYIEDITLKAGITITCNLSNYLGTILQGTVTLSSGSCNITNFRLFDNADATILDISGGELRLNNCHLRMSAAVGITISSGTVQLINCTMGQVFSGNRYLNMSGGEVNFLNCSQVDTSNDTTTASTISSGTVKIFNSRCIQRFSFTGDSILVAESSVFSAVNPSSTIFTLDTSGSCKIKNCTISNGTTAPITVTQTLTITNTTIDTSATPAIDGAGTISYANLVFVNGSGISTTTQTTLAVDQSHLVSSSNSALTNTNTIENTENTNAASSAQFVAQVGGTSGGDPSILFNVPSTTQWIAGIDNSATTPSIDPYVISQGTALGTNDCVQIGTTGTLNYPLQPSFLAQSAVVNNVTGDNTAYTMTFTSEIFDNNSDFDGTSTFTAPVTGRYQLNIVMFMKGLTASHTSYRVDITTSNRTYEANGSSAAAAKNAADQYGTSASTLVDMDASDTAFIVITISNGTKVADTTLQCYFSMFLQS